MSLLKVILPIAIGGGLIAFLASDASASEPTSTLSDVLKERIKAALATGEPAQLRALAKELEDAGFKAQAASLRKAADQIENAMSAVPETEPGKAPAPTKTKRKHVRVLVVQKGDGPWQVANRIGMGSAARELRDRNIPRDGKGKPRQSDGKGGFTPTLEPGDLLIVPEQWTTHPSMKTVALPSSVSGDDDDSTPLRRLAGRVALEVFETEKGHENRELIETYQKAMNAAGYKLRVSGLYDAQTAASLAKVHHIAPPIRFKGGRELYWPTNPTPAKKQLRALLLELAQRDDARAAEWSQVARDVA
jgi:hypothetical protein